MEEIPFRQSIQFAKVIVDKVRSVDVDGKEAGTHYRVPASLYGAETAAKIF